MDRRKFMKNAAVRGLGMAGLSATLPSSSSADERGRPGLPKADTSDRPNLLFRHGGPLRTMSCRYAGDRYGGTYLEPKYRPENIELGY